MGFPQHREMVDGLASDGTNRSFDMAILPEAPRRDRSVSNADRAKPLSEHDAHKHHRGRGSYDGAPHSRGRLR